MKYFIVANGDFLPRALLLEIAAEGPIIALDGALPRLMQRGIMPNYVLGDFDSIENKAQFGIQAGVAEDPGQADTAYEGRFGLTILPRVDQDYTDLQKGIRFAKEQGASEINIACAMGGTRIDHSVFGLRLLRAEAEDECDIRIHYQGCSATYVKDGTVTIRGEVNDQCAILAMPEGGFSSAGLVWNGDERSPFPLQVGYSESACNMMAQEQASVTVTGEALVMHPPMYPEQRAYNLLLRRDQLAQLYEEECFELVEITVGEFRRVYDLQNVIAGMLAGHQPELAAKLSFDDAYFVTATKDALLAELDEGDAAILSMPPKAKTRFDFFKDKTPADIRADESEAYRWALA